MDMMGILNRNFDDQKYDQINYEVCKPRKIQASARFKYFFVCEGGGLKL